jgi:hypothetical protein
MLKPVSEILKQLQLINQDLKEHNDRMDEKYGRSDVLPTSDARIGNATSCPYKCEGDNK